MNKVETKVKKTVRCKVTASPKVVKIKFPKQNVGSVALFFMKPTGKAVFEKGKAPKPIYEDKLLRQWELVLQGDKLKVIEVK